MRVSIDAIIAAFDGPLLLIEDEQERQRIARVLQASRPAVENAVYRVFADAFAGLNENLDGSKLEVRLVPDGIDVEAVEDLEPSSLESDFTFLSGDVEKLTLRIIDPLKKAAAEAAAEEGRSLNNWISAALARSLERRSRQARSEARSAARAARRAARQARRGAEEFEDDD